MKSQELYDRHSETDPEEQQLRAPALRNVEMAEWLAAEPFCHQRDQTAVLELGFGDGELSRVIVQRISSARLVGYDISQARVMAARAMASRHGLAERLDYRTMDTDEGLGQLYAASVDVLVAIDVLEHVFDVFGFVANVARIVRPGGLVLLRVPNVAYVKHRLTLARGALPVTSSWFGPPGNLASWRATWGWDGGHLHLFTLATLRSLLQDAGLKPRRWGDPGSSWPALRDRAPGLLCGNLCVLAERV